MLTSHAKTIAPQRLLRDGLIASAQRHPDKEAVVIEGKAYSYAELLESSLCIAAALKKRGVLRGDRIAIYMNNTWPCVVSIYAILLSGGAFMAINPQTKSEKLQFMLEDSEAKILITESQQTKIFLPAIQNIKSLNNIIVSGDFDFDTIPKHITYENFEVVSDKSEPLQSPVSIIPNDLAALIYTSGSTGFPKGVMQSHQSMVFAAWSLIEYQRLSENDRILLVLPIAFDYGLYQLLMAMKLGATLIVERSFIFPTLIYKRIEEQKVTVFPAVPMIYAMMISSHKKKRLCFSSITRITNTAAALSAELIPYLHEIFPNALIYKMYGLTECKRVSYLEPELIDEKPASVGRAIPGTEVYLLSTKGEPVELGETGILHVRGPHLMMGYWKRPEQSKEMLHPGKFPGEKVLCTGDLFRMDEDGLLYFVGRSDDIIKTRGEKVSPVEVENTLVGFAGIKEAAVIGIADNIYGQVIKAFVSLDSGAELNEKKIKKECSEKLENYMMPNEIIIMEELPKTDNGKLDKKILAQASTEIEEHECFLETSG